MDRQLAVGLLVPVMVLAAVGAIAKQAALLATSLSATTDLGTLNVLSQVLWFGIGVVGVAAAGYLFVDRGRRVAPFETLRVASLAGFIGILVGYIVITTVAGMNWAEAAVLDAIRLLLYVGIEGIVTGLFAVGGAAIALGRTTDSGEIGRQADQAP